MPEPNLHTGRQLKVGDRLAGKYALARRIAVGGMGEIWVAKNEMTAADVAVKVLRGDIERKADVEARFRHEAQVGATLSHRNVVKVFDLAAEPDGTLVLVMELLRGETLRRALKVRAGPLSAVESVAIMGPVLSALQHAHELGVIHRDLKPANILLAVDPDGHVTPKLLDFGIAKVPKSSVKTLFGRVLGTPRYMSPEQIRGDAKLDGRSDVFSAGVLLIEMLTGSSPFRAPSPSASLAAVLEQEVDPDERIDPQLWLVIKRAIAKRPYERYASAAEFGAALRKAVTASDADLQDALRTAQSTRTSYADLSDVFVTRRGNEAGEDSDSSHSDDDELADAVDEARTDVGGPAFEGDGSLAPSSEGRRPGAARSRIRMASFAALGVATIALAGALWSRRTPSTSAPLAAPTATVTDTASSKATGEAPSSAGEVPTVVEGPIAPASSPALTSPAHSDAPVKTTAKTPRPTSPSGTKKKPVGKAPDF